MNVEVWRCLVASLCPSVVPVLVFSFLKIVPFGQCEGIPSVLLVTWRATARLEAGAIHYISTLSLASLSLAFVREALAGTAAIVGCFLFCYAYPSLDAICTLLEYRY